MENSTALHRKKLVPTSEAKAAATTPSSAAPSTSTPAATYPVVTATTSYRISYKDRIKALPRNQENSCA
jgi:hypothetical protein